MKQADTHSFVDLLDQKLREALEQRLTYRNYSNGQFIIDHMDDQTDVFLLMSGRAEVRVFSASGKVIAFRTIWPGDIFGELSAIDALPRSASVIARQDTKTGSLTKQAFRTCVQEEPDLAWALLRHLASQVRTVSNQLMDFRTLAASERLIVQLTALADAGEAKGDKIFLSDAPGNQDLAVLIGSQREAVSRDMSKLVNDGLIKREGRTLIFLDPERLQALIVDQE